MFMQRLITSLILVPLVLLIIFYAPNWLITSIFLLIVLAAVKECWLLIPITKTAMQLGFLFLMLLSLWACGHLFSYWLILGLILWAFNCIAIVTFPQSQGFWGYPVVVAGICLVLLPLFIQSLLKIYYLPQGKELMVFLLFFVWAADIGAYLIGKQWGKHKLIPEVSPGKSWEGVLSGGALAMVIAGVGYFYFVPFSVSLWFLIAAVVWLITIFGDLFISILKRRCHLKDTGALIPGHGGILDRLDSLIAAAPVFYLGVTYISFMKNLG